MHVIGTRLETKVQVRIDRALLYIIRVAIFWFDSVRLLGLLIQVRVQKSFIELHAGVCSHVPVGTVFLKVLVVILE